MARDQDDFHYALKAAIRANERYDHAKATLERSQTLSRDARDLIRTSRELARKTKSRLASKATRIRARG